MAFLNEILKKSEEVEEYKDVSSKDRADAACLVFRKMLQKYDPQRSCTMKSSVLRKCLDQQFPRLSQA